MYKEAFKRLVEGNNYFSEANFLLAGTKRAFKPITVQVI